MTNNHVDYDTIEVPEHKPLTEYNWRERRARILRLIKRTGDAYTVPQEKLAERFGVSQGQISQDLDRIGEYLEPHLASKVKMSMWAAVRAALDEADSAYEKMEILERWARFLQKTGDMETEPEKHEIEQTMIDGSKTDSYEIVAPDETIEGETVDIAQVRAANSRDSPEDSADSRDGSTSVNPDERVGDSG